MGGCQNVGRGLCPVGILESEAAGKEDVWRRTLLGRKWLSKLAFVRRSWFVQGGSWMVVDKMSGCANVGRSF